ncbi:MAG TPA: helix-turn-helix domain-containing protein [Hydrogenophaga sp.]
MTHLRSNVAHLMALRGLNQEQLAKAAGMTQPNISRFLNSKTDDLQAGSAAGLARLFGVTLDDLVNHDFRGGEPTAKSSQSDLDLDALASSLVALDKAMQALNIPYRAVHEMAPTLRYAYKHLARNPGMPNSERALFDDALIGKLRENLDATPARPKRRAATGDQRRAKDPKA